MTCKYCGREIDKDSLFCEYCGKELNREEREEKQITVNDKKTMFHQKGKNAFLSFVVLAIIIILGFSIYKLLFDDQIETDGIVYVINNDGTVSVKGLKNKSLMNIIIPSEIDIKGKKYSVSSIHRNAFHNCLSLTSVTIPNSVTSIECRAFCGCSSLISVIIPNSVTSISSGVFYGCTSLASVTIPNSVTSIGDCVFEGTAWERNQPEGIVYLGKWAYKYKGPKELF